MLKKTGSAFILTFIRFHEKNKKCLSSFHSSIQILYKKISLLNLSADDPVHQQEGHLWPLHGQAGRVSAPQCGGHLRQIHQHVSTMVHHGQYFITVTFRRYQDKSSAKHNLDDFLKNAYSKQMKELNGTTG